MRYSSYEGRVQSLPGPQREAVTLSFAREAASGTVRVPASLGAVAVPGLPAGPSTAPVRALPVQASSWAGTRGAPPRPEREAVPAEPQGQLPVHQVSSFAAASSVTAPVRPLPVPAPPRAEERPGAPPRQGGEAATAEAQGQVPVHKLRARWAGLQQDETRGPGPRPPLSHAPRANPSPGRGAHAPRASSYVAAATGAPPVLRLPQARQQRVEAPPAARRSLSASSRG